MAGDEAEAGLFHARAHAVDEAELPDGRLHDLVVDGLLDPIRCRFPSGPAGSEGLADHKPAAVPIRLVGSAPVCRG